MILADKIIDLRKKNSWSQEELAEKLNVSRQSVSKWESGMSVPDLNKIIAMSELFGVSTDYLVKDTIEVPTPSESAARDDDTDTRPVSAEEANRYLALVEKVSERIALGVALCILSPVLLILLSGMSAPDIMAGAPLMSVGVAVSIGLIALLALVATAVSLFILNGLKLSEFSYLDREAISLDYGVQGIVEKKLSDYRPRFATMVTVGVVLCIISVLPLLILGVTGVEEIYIVTGVGLLLAGCSVGVAIIVWAGFINGSYQRLLQEGDFRAEKKSGRNGELYESVTGAYWCLVTGGYLLWSFLSGDWHITWIIWIIAVAGQFVIDAVLEKKK